MQSGQDSNLLQLCHKEYISTQPWGGATNQWSPDYFCKYTKVILNNQVFYDTDGVGVIDGVLDIDGVTDGATPDGVTDGVIDGVTDGVA